MAAYRFSAVSDGQAISFSETGSANAAAAQLITSLQGGLTLAGAAIAALGSGVPSPIIGTDGDDSLTGTSANDVIDGRGGNDTLDGQDGQDLLIGGDGNDLLVHYVNSNVDTLDGGLGDDTYDLRSSPFLGQNAVLVDAGGVDTIFSNHDLVLPAGFENLELFEGNVGTGNALNNVIVTHTNEASVYWVDGADGDDTLLGGENADFFLFQAGSGVYGNDSVDGGADFDTLDFTGARSAIVADMRTGSLSGGGTLGAGTVTYAGIEAITGGAFDDQLTANDGAVWVAPGGGEDVFRGPVLSGGGGNDTLTGGASIDTLRGDSGIDVLSGRGGTDFLFGGSEADRFIFDVAPGEANADRIIDFASASDEIHLLSAVHADLGGAGRFATDDARFSANATGVAQDASDRVIYNTTTGELWHDADGSGLGAAQLIATLTNIPALAATDIWVI